MLEIDSLEDVAALRESLDIELEGGESDCQNHALHEMFLLIGLGKRAGTVALSKYLLRGDIIE
ncbi:hypothetical protein [Cellvibrio sp. OA-2007]|uniref:hypothetical protein n=1 Tax=Cellvibrio sp. OA-2007 TaxID=529823 RepID=UPI000785AABC|nr:hypothetical protein [Cellvibrio sp. OA-2007]